MLKLPFTATLLHPLCLTDVQTFLRVLLVPRPHLLVRKETIGAIKADMAALKNAGFLGSSSDLMCQPSKRNIIGSKNKTQHIRSRNKLSNLQILKVQWHKYRLSTFLGEDRLVCDSLRLCVCVSTASLRALVWMPSQLGLPVLAVFGGLL